MLSSEPYSAITKIPAGATTLSSARSDGPGQQPIQYRRLPNGQVVRVVTVAVPPATGNGTNSKVRMPPTKSRKYEMKHPGARAAPPGGGGPLRGTDEQGGPVQGIYRKYTPVSGWQGMSEQDKLNQ